MNYKLGKLIGRGGDGDVYELNDKEIIKFIQPTPEGFENYLEAYITLYLEHPNIMKTKRIEIANNHLIKIVQDKASKDLNQMIYKEKISRKKKYQIMKNLVSVIYFLQSHSIIHGDIKPHNILIMDDTIKLNDFTRSRLVDNLYNNQILYTFLYRPPESYKKKVNLKSDIWALGCTLYEIYYGRKYHNYSGSKIFHLVCPEEIKEENFKLNQLIYKMVNKRIDKRPEIEEIAEFFQIEEKWGKTELILRDITTPKDAIFYNKIYHTSKRKKIDNNYKQFEQKLSNEIKFDIFSQLS